MADIIAYIDGFNLYHRLRDRYQHRYLWLVADAASSSADLALLISADSDLCPAIRMVRILAAARQTRFGIVAAFPPRRNSHEIKRLIPGAFTLSHQDIRNSLLPDTITDTTSGRTFHRPHK